MSIEKNKISGAENSPEIFIDSENLLFSFESGFELYEISERFFSVFPEGKRKSNYDVKAKFYDYIIGNEIYNKIVWGNSKKDYENFCSLALSSSESGAVLDAGCGTLVFTAEAYSRCRKRPVILVDRSLTMLEKAAERLKRLNGEIPSNIILLQADIFNLPFKNNFFRTVNSFGMLHLFDDTRKFLVALDKILSEKGKMFLLVLLAENKRGKFFTKGAKITGEIALSLDARQMSKRIESAGFENKLETKGNVGYVVIEKND